MRDYASYFIERKKLEKRGVAINRDIDWWMEYLAGKMAKMLFVALLAVLFLVLKALWQLGKSQAVFPIDNVTLSGDVLITQPQDITKQLAKFSNKSFFNTDIQQVAESITALSWIESATVKRHWSNGLDIHVVERKPAFRWGDNELVDADGNRFANVDNALFADLPKIYGAAGHEQEVIFSYRQLMTELGNRQAEDLAIASLELKPYLSWELHLQSGLVVKFGRDDYEAQLKRFIEAYQRGKLPELVQLDSLDCRYKNGCSAKWKPEFAPVTPEQPFVKVSLQSI